MASIRTIKGKKGTHYKIEVSNGYTVDGKKIRKTTTFIPDLTMTKKQQEQALQKFAAEFEAKVKNGNRIEGDKISLSQFTEEWMTTYAENQLEKTTVWRYRYVLDSIILPALGHLKLAKIRPYDVSKFLVSLARDGARKDGEAGGYAHESIRKAKIVLSSVLSTAVRWDMIENNPCLKADLPKQEEPEERIKAYTLEEARRLLQFAEEQYRKSGGNRPSAALTSAALSALQTLVLVYIAIFGGLRRGELVGLDWRSVDFEKNIIHITQSAARTGSEEFVKTPKSRRSIRSVAFPQPVMDWLLLLRQEQLRYRDAAGDKWVGTGDCVFIRADGRRMDVSTPYRCFRRLVRKYNSAAVADLKLPVLSLHCLRHTNASLLVRSNRVDIVSVSKKLGHADPNITARYYLHSYEEGERETAEILGDMLLCGGEKAAK